jgi:uncharacterized protein
MPTERANPPVEPLPPALVEALSDGRAFPHDPSAASGVEHVQTHISHVFLTGERVYKFRKAVRPAFLDFGTRAAREADCLREIALNRRLAPDVYLGVAPLREEAGALRVGETAEWLAPGVLEHCAVMRRLPHGRDALSLLEQGALGALEIDAIAAAIADFHDDSGLGTPPTDAPDVWLASVCGPIEDNLRALAQGDLREQAAELAQRTERALAAARVEILRRQRDGRGVDGHGDLHLQHVWLERAQRAGGERSSDARPIFIDCLEFSDALRRVDAACDIGFLAMDLIYRGEPRLAARLLRRYARARDDFDLYTVVDLFMSYRAAVRAKVADLAARGAELSEEQRRGAAGSARRHLELACALLRERGPAVLVAVAGVVGTGKTTAAEVLADELGGVVISSDRVRKRLAGLRSDERSGAALGIYTEEWNERVYAGLLARARPVLASGRAAILDATWSEARQRVALRALAQELGVALRIVETRCAEATARERLARRREQGGDPSDAGPERYAASAEKFEPAAPTESAAWLCVETDRPDWERTLREWARAGFPERAGD